MVTARGATTLWATDSIDAAELLEEAAEARPAWHADAACREAPPEVSWFPELGGDGRPAKAVCARCLVLAECRGWALGQDPDLAGIWGGTSAQQRQVIRAGQGVR